MDPTTATSAIATPWMYSDDTVRKAKAWAAANPGDYAKALERRESAPSSKPSPPESAPFTGTTSAVLKAPAVVPVNKTEGVLLTPASERLGSDPRVTTPMEAKQYAPTMDPVKGVAEFTGLPEWSVPYIPLVGMPLTAASVAGKAAGYISGAYAEATGEQRVVNSTKDVVAAYSEVYGAPIQSTLDSVSMSDFINQGTNYYLRQVAFAATGKESPVNLPPEVYAAAKAEASKLVARDLAQAKAAGAVFVLPNPEAVSVGMDFAKEYLPKGSESREAVNWLLTVPAEALLVNPITRVGTSLTPGGKVALDITDDGRLNAPVIEGYEDTDPVGLGALALDTAIAAILPYGRQIEAGWNQKYYARAGVTNPVFRFLGGTDTTLASLAAWSRSGIDPRVMASADYSMAEEGYKQAKAAVTDTGMPGWAQEVAGLGGAALGLVGGVGTPGLDVVTVAGAAKAYRAAAQSGLILPGYRAMVNLADSVEELEKAQKSVDEMISAAERATGSVGPEPAARMRQAASEALAGKGSENFYGAMVNARVARDEAGLIYMNAPNAAAKAVAKSALDAAEAQYRTAHDLWRATKNLSAGAEQIAQLSNTNLVIRSVERLTDALAKVQTASIDDFVKKVSKTNVAKAFRGGQDGLKDAVRKAEGLVVELGKAAKAQTADLVSLEKRLADDVAKGTRDSARAQKKIARLSRTATSQKSVIQNGPELMKANQELAAAEALRLGAQAKLDDLAQIRAARAVGALGGNLSPDEARVAQGWVNAQEMEAAIAAYNPMLVAVKQNAGTAHWSVDRQAFNAVAQTFANLPKPLTAATQKTLDDVANLLGDAASEMMRVEADALALKARVTTNLEVRLKDLEKAPSQFVEWMRNTAEAYKAQGGGTRLPDQVLDLLVARGVAPTRNDAQHMVDSANVVMAAMFDPAHYQRAGLNALTRRVRSMGAAWIRGWNPVAERLGNLNPEVLRAQVMSERVFRAASSDIISLIADTWQDAAKRMDNVDAWLEGKDISVGGRFLGNLQEKMKFIGWAPDAIKQKGVAWANTVRVRNTSGKVARTLPMWEVLKTKWAAIPVGPKNIDELAAANPEIEALAKMWIGNVDLEDDVLSPLRMAAVRLLQKGVDPKTFREQMKMVTLRSTKTAQHIDIQPLQVIRRQAQAASFAGSTERFALEMESITGVVGEKVIREAQEMLAGNYAKVTDMNAARRYLARLGLPVSLPRGVTGEKLISASAKETLKNKSPWVVSSIVDAQSQMASEFIKTHRRNIAEGGESGFMANLLGMVRRGQTTGLLIPRPTHHINNLFGNACSVWQAQGFSAAAWSLTAGFIWQVPALNRALAKVGASAMERMAKRGPLLPSTIKAWGAPVVDAIMQGKQGTITLGNKVWSFDELRRLWTEEGVFASFVSTDGLHEELMRGATQAHLSWAKSTAQAWSEGIGDIADAMSQRQRALFILEELNRHGDPVRAGKNMQMALYDYANGMTNWEKKWLRSMVIPYWNFWRNAIKQQLAMSLDLIRDPSMVGALRSPYGNMREQVIAYKSVLSALQPEDPEEAQRYALVTGFHDSRIRTGTDELDSRAVQAMRNLFARDVDSVYRALPPFQTLDVWNVMLSTAMLPVWAADEAAGWGLFSEDAGEYLLTPVLDLTLTKGMFAHLIEKYAEVETGEGEFTTVPPALVAAENNLMRYGGGQPFTYKEREGKPPLMDPLTGLVIDFIPEAAGLITLYQNTYLLNVGRLSADPNASGREQMVHFMTKTLPEGVLGTMGLQTRMYSASKNEEWASVVAKRYVDQYVEKKKASFRPTNRGAVGIYSLEDIEDMKREKKEKDSQD